MAAESSSLPNEPLHLVDGVRNLKPKPVKGRSDWIQADCGFEIAKHYIQGRLGLVVCFKAPLPKGRDADLAGSGDNFLGVGNADGLPVLPRPVWTYNYAIAER